MSFVTLKLYQGDGTTLIGELPSFKQLQPMVTLNDVGVLSLQYPVNGIRSSYLYDGNEREIAVVIDGTERMRYLLEDDGRSTVEADLKKSVLTIAGREVSQLLDRARVFPINGVGVAPYNYPFVNASPGTILTTLISQAQGRGALTGWTTSFTGTHDSNGVAWPSNITFTYKPQNSVLDVAKHISQTLGLIDWRVSSGRTLDAYVAGTYMAQDRTGARFSRGKDANKAEQNRSKRDTANVFIVEGDNNTQVVRTDNTSISARGRYEQYFSQSGVTDPGTLDVVGDLQLSYRSGPRVAYPLSVDFRSSTPKPFTDFWLGDYVYLDGTSFRLVQMSLTLNNSSIVHGDLDLNDKFDSREVIAARIIAGLSGNLGNGASVTNSDYTPDTTVPSAPAAPSVTTATYQTVQDVSVAVNVTWPAVTTNTDGSTINDLKDYSVQWKYSSDSSWRSAGTVGVTTIAFSSVMVNRSIDVRVAANDYNGHTSAWSATTTVTTVSDTAPPPVPSTPVLDVSTLPLLARTTWDGKDNGGATEAGNGNFEYLEVHASSVSGFTPSSSTLKTTITGASLFPIEWPANTAIYVVFVAVSRSGIKSAPSAQATATVRQAQDGEIISITASKITAGTISSDIVLSGRFATALTGARRELNVNGFQSWDASNNLTISLDGVNNLLTGVFKTALTGRRIEMGSGGTTGEIDFYAPDGTKSILLSYTESGGLEAMQFGIPIPVVPVSSTSNLWNRINYNNDNGGWANYRANKHEFVFGGINNASGTDSGHPGLFHILQTSNYGAAAFERFKIDGSTIVYWDATATARLQINPTTFYIYDSAGTNRVQIDSGTTGDVWFQWSGTNKRALIRPDYSSPDGSAQLQLINPHNYGVVLRNASTGTGSLSRLDVMDAVASVYEDINGGVYTNASTAVGKENITTFQLSARDKLKTAKPRTYRRKSRLNSEGVSGAERPTELGLIAEEMPEEVRTYDFDGTTLIGINTSALHAMFLGYLQEIDAELTDLKSQLTGGK